MYKIWRWKAKLNWICLKTMNMYLWINGIFLIIVFRCYRNGAKRNVFPTSVFLHVSWYLYSNQTQTSNTKPPADFMGFTVFNHDTSFRLLLKSHLYIQDLSLGTRFPNLISIFQLFIFFFFFAYCNHYARYSTFSSFNFPLVWLSFFKSSPVHARVLFTDKDPV